MKIDRGWMLNDYIEPNRKQYCIPVFQRDYALAFRPVGKMRIVAPGTCQGGVYGGFGRVNG